MRRTVSRVLALALCALASLGAFGFDVAAGDSAWARRAEDAESITRYLALNTLLVNLDSYNGSGHNYYLYEHAGVFAVIPGPPAIALLGLGLLARGRRRR